MLATLINLGLALLCLKAPAFIERAGMSRKGAIILSFLNVAAWAPLIAAFLLSRLGIAPVWFAAFWFINSMPAVLLSIHRDNWLSSLVPRNSLGRYLGQRLAIKSAFYLGSFIILGYLLDAFGVEALSGFAFVFILAMAASLVDFVIFTFMNDSRPADAPVAETPPGPRRFGMVEYLGELRENKLGTFVTFTSFFYFSVGICGPLYAVYIFQDLHFSYLAFTVIVSAEYFARIASVPFWGRLADRVGNIRVLGIVTRIIPVVPVFWLFSPGLAYLVFVQVLSGVCWGAFDLCTQSYLFKVAPREKKLHYIVYTRSLVLFSMALGGLLGALFARGIFFTFGSRILSVFLVSGIFRAGIAIYLMPGLVDLAVSYRSQSRRPELNLDYSGGVTPAKHGLFYHRHERMELTEPARPPLRSKIAKSRTATGAVRPADPPRGWFRNQDLRTAAAGARPVRRRPEPLPKTRTSLYHDPAGWSSYMRETLKNINREAREWKAAAARKTPCPVYILREAPPRPGKRPGRGEMLSENYFWFSSRSRKV